MVSCHRGQNRLNTGDNTGLNGDLCNHLEVQRDSCNHRAMTYFAKLLSFEIDIHGREATANITFMSGGSKSVYLKAQMQRWDPLLGNTRHGARCKVVCVRKL